jgi:hypothetical protein
MFDWKSGISGKFCKSILKIYLNNKEYIGSREEELNRQPCGMKI